MRPKGSRNTLVSDGPGDVCKGGEGSGENSPLALARGVDPQVIFIADDTCRRLGAILSNRFPGNVHN